MDQEVKRQINRGILHGVVFAVNELVGMLPHFETSTFHALAEQGFGAEDLADLHRLLFKLGVSAKRAGKIGEAA